MTKVNYVDNQTVIYADNLNEIQDCIIENQGNIATKQDKLTAGDGIAINGNIISATGAVSDVKVDGTSVVADHVANITSYDDTTVKADIAANTTAIREIKADLGDDPETDEKWQEVLALLESDEAGWSSLVDLCLYLPTEAAGEKVKTKIDEGNDILYTILLKLEGELR